MHELSMPWQQKKKRTSNLSLDLDSSDPTKKCPLFALLKREKQITDFLS